MHIDIRNYLVEIARRRSTCSYSDLNVKFKLGLDFDHNLDRAKIGDTLGDVATYEYQQDRPILSAVVVHSGDKLQGNGIYCIGEHLTGKPAGQLKKEFFAEMQMKSCYEYWRDDDNYAEHGMVKSLVW